MAGITLPDDQKVTVPLVFQDAIGTHVAPPSGGSVQSDAPAVATATLEPGGASVVIDAVADGTANVTYTDGIITASLQVTVTAPTATAAEFDTAGATFAPKA